MALALGCIADDYTGASDLAGVLSARGLRTVQTVGVPPVSLELGEVDAVVVALKSRSIHAGRAVELSLAALDWLRERDAGHVMFQDLLDVRFDGRRQYRTGARRASDGDARGRGAGEPELRRNGDGRFIRAICSCRRRCCRTVH